MKSEIDGGVAADFDSPINNTNSYSIYAKERN